MNTRKTQNHITVVFVSYLHTILSFANNVKWLSAAKIAMPNGEIKKE